MYSPDFTITLSIFFKFVHALFCTVCTWLFITSFNVLTSLTQFGGVEFPEFCLLYETSPLKSAELTPWVCYQLLGHDFLLVGYVAVHFHGSGLPVKSNSLTGHQLFFLEEPNLQMKKEKIMCCQCPANNDNFRGMKLF